MLYLNPHRISTSLICRFFLDLREGGCNNDDADVSHMSTMRFTANTFTGNIGEPLEHSRSTWISGAGDDLDDVGQYER